MTLKTRVALVLSVVTGLIIVWTFWQAGHSQVIDGALPLQFGAAICNGNVQDIGILYVPGGLALSQQWQDYLNTFKRGCTASIDFSSSLLPWQSVFSSDQIDASRVIPITLKYPPEAGISALSMNVTLVRLKTGDVKVWPDFSLPPLTTTGRAFIDSSYAVHLATFEVSQPAIAFKFKGNLYLGVQVKLSPMGQNLTSFTARLYSYANALTEAHGVGDVNELPQKYRGAFSSTEGRAIDKGFSPVMWLWYSFSDPALFNPARLYLGMQVNVENGGSPSQIAFVQVDVDQRPAGQSPLYNTKLSVLPAVDIFQDVKLIKNEALSTNGAGEPTSWQWQFSLVIDTSHLAPGEQVELGCDSTILYLNDDTGITPQSCGGYNQIFASGEKRKFTLTFQLDNPGKTPQAVRLEYRFYLEGVMMPVTIWHSDS